MVILPLIVLALMLVSGGIWLIQQDVRRIGAPHLVTWGVFVALSALTMAVLQGIVPQPAADAWFLTAVVETGSLAVALLALGMAASFASLPGTRSHHLYKILAGVGGLVVAAALVVFHLAFYGRIPVVGTLLMCLMSPLLVPAMSLITLWWWGPLQQRLQRRAAYRERHDLRAVLVLGAGIRADGAPTRLLARRIDKGLEVSRTLPASSPVVMCGGQGPDEPQTEASSMAAYAREAGFDANRIVQEDTSTSTLENLVHARKLLQDSDVLDIDRASNHGVVVVTSDYHVPRAADTMRQARLHGVALASKGHPAYRKAARIREVAALLVGRPAMSILTLIVTLIPALTAVLGLVG